MATSNVHHRLLRADTLALAGFLLLTLGLTCPLALHFAQAIPGDGFDGWQNCWNLWWVRLALLEKHTHPFFTDLLFYPTGVSLLFHTLNPFNGLLALPVQVAWGLLPAYNVVVLFSFVAGGYGAYLLARRWLGPRGTFLPAFAAGVVFTFSPFHFAHLLGHMQVISLEWIPFYALYLLRAVEGALGRPGLPTMLRASPVSSDEGWHLADWLRALRGGVLRDGLMAALCLVLMALCDWYFVLYSLLFTVIVVAWAAWRTLRHAGLRKVFLPALLAGAIPWLAFGTVLSPLLVPMIAEASHFRFMVPDPSHSRVLSADLLAFVTPQEFHPLWGAWARERARAFTSSLAEHQVFAGYVPLLLAGWGVWSRLRAARYGRFWCEQSGQAAVAEGREATCQKPGQGHGSREAGVGLWSLSLVVFFVLALGPVLHIGGVTALLPGGREIPLPYGWLVRVVPFMEISRSVSRLDVMVMLSLSLLAAIALSWLSRPTGLVALGLILFEFLPVPYPLSQPDTPDWYRTLATDPRPGAVLNLPMAWDRPGYLLHQTVHGKPLAVAYISRNDPRTLTERAPVLQHLRHLQPDILAFDLAAQGQQVLYELGIRWVVLDRYQMPGGPEREYTDAVAGLIFAGQAPVYEDMRLTVFEVAPPARALPYLILGTEWGPFDNTVRGRWLSGCATLIVQAPARGYARLRITTTPGSASLSLADTSESHAGRLLLQPGPNELTLCTSTENEQALVTGIALEMWEPAP